MPSADYYNNLGVQLRAAGQYQEAEQAYRQALALDPQYGSAWFNLGNLLAQLDRPNEAIFSYQQTIRLEPVSRDTAHAYSNMGTVLQAYGLFNEAEIEYRHALELKPALHEARFNLACVQLFQGNLAEGLPNFESRLSVAQFDYVFPTSLPVWLGNNHDKKDQLTVYTDKGQGLGDTLWLARFFPLLCSHFSKVRFLCPPAFQRLCRASFPDIDIVDKTTFEQGASNINQHWGISLMSVPAALALDMSSIPAQIPYLKILPAWLNQKESSVATKAEGTTQKPRIGIAWQGRPGTNYCAQRDIALVTLLKLFETGSAHDCQWISLNFPSAAEQLTTFEKEFGIAIEDPIATLITPSQHHDLADTAVLIQTLDLVISVDTATAHLAGALGKPVFLLNRWQGDWRWMHQRADSPWYPGMKIFFQRTAGDWQAPIDELSIALQAMLKEFLQK